MKISREKVNQVKSEVPFKIPFTVLCDGREKQPYRFHGIYADSKLKYRPLIIPWEWTHLKTGDYSIKGFDNYIAIERKSAIDLYSTLGRHRKRFELEHQRLAELDFAAVVIESSWQRIIKKPPERTKLNPKTIYRTAIAWSIKYRVPWFTVEGRRLAELTTFRLLERWWYYLQEELGESNSRCRICNRSLRVLRSTGKGMGPICTIKSKKLNNKRN